MAEDGLLAILQLIAELFSCGSAAIVWTDYARPVADVSLTVGPLDEKALRRYRTTYAALDPAPAAMARLAIGEAAATDRMFSAAERHASTFFREFYQPLGLVETLGGPIAKDGGRFGILAVHRGSDRPPFADSEITDFGALTPHVARAMQLRAALFASRARADGLTAAVDQLALGILVLHQDRTVACQNKAAREFLADGYGLMMDRSGRLTSENTEISKRLREFFSSGHPASTFAVPRRKKERYFARLVRPPHGAEILAILSDPDRQNGGSGELLTAIFGLTRAEARLALAIAQGEDLRVYASRTGISLNTAKFHLKSIFVATGAKRQAELVRKVTGIIHDLEGIA